MLIFVHIEKTGGTSLNFMFSNSFGRRYCNALDGKTWLFSQDDLDFARKIFGEIKCVSGHNIFEPTKHLHEKDLFFLTMIRDPILRSASYYQDNFVRGSYEDHFEAWIQDESKHNMQTKRIAGSEDVEKAKQLLRDAYHFVGLTERFEESLKLLSVLSPEKLNLAYKKKLIAQDNRIKNELLSSPKSLQALQDANQLDMELYRYVKEELFPARLQAHQEAVDRVILPQNYTSRYRPFKYHISLLFNKFIYRKLSKRRAARLARQSGN